MHKHQAQRSLAGGRRGASRHEGVEVDQKVVIIGVVRYECRHEQASRLCCPRGIKPWVSSIRKAGAGIVAVIGGLIGLSNEHAAESHLKYVRPLEHR